MKALILIILIFSVKSFALENTVKHVDNRGVIDTLDSNYKNGFFFFNEGLHRGVKFESTDQHGHKKVYDTRDDKHHISFTGNFNLDMANLSDIVGFDLSYGYHFATDGSLEFIVSKSNPLYTRVADPFGNEELGNTKEDLLSIGLGLGWRSDLIQSIIPWEHLFDTFNFYLTYNIFDELYSAKNFSGAGFRVDYLMKYRFTKTFHFGLKVAYALAWTTRDQEFENESRSDRRLNLGLMTMGLDIGLNF
ncbi:MAG: hypothetical protein DRQ89_11405 [Epsilonproteobacteria bacterium]|nr:MAG: hypothetical protein DRQ89_11405 [Campylobacterota bacterium]